MLEYDTLLKKHRKTLLAGLEDLEHTLDYGREGIERIIPHRDPFLLVDRLTGLSLTSEVITGIRTVRADEPLFQGHFPGYPVMPASLLIEGMAQTAGILVGEANNFSEKVILAKVKRAVFHSLVTPGQQVRHEATLEQMSGAAAMTSGRIYCGAELVGEVDIVFSHIDQNISGLEFPEENFVFTDEFMALLKMYREQAATRGAL